MHQRSSSWLGKLPSTVRSWLTLVPVSFTLCLAACGGDSRVVDNTAPVPSASKPASTPTVPSVPSGLTATAGNAQVNLSWSPSTGATSYNLARTSATSGPFTPIKTTTTTSFMDSGLTNGTTYFYVVSAVNSVGNSADSGAISSTPVAPAAPTPPPVQVPGIPAGLTASGGNATVTLSWSASSGATSYNLGRATGSNGPFTQIKTTATTSFADTGLTNGTTYFYVVAAVNSAGNSADSGAVSSTPVAPASPTPPKPPTPPTPPTPPAPPTPPTPPAPPTPPTPPTTPTPPPVQAPAVPAGLTASAGNATVTLAWSASSGATSYSLGRATGSSGPFTQVTTTSSTSFVNSGLSNGTTYFYVVSATNSGGSSANSAPVSATPTAPVTPSGPTYALPPDRVTMWQPGVSYAPTSGKYAPVNAPSGWSGGIPARTAVCATLSPSGGDDTAAINSAIAACPANQTVLLTAGTFVISGGGIHIKNSYVTLRGSGAGPGMGGALTAVPNASAATLLVKSDGNANPYPVITIGSITTINTMWQTAAFAADATQGANSVELTGSPPSGLAPGEIVYVDETYDPALSWYNTNGGQGNGTGFDGWGEGEYGIAVGSSRPIGQTMEVASISGNTVTFTTPFHQSYRTAFSAHLGRINLSQRTSWAGLENLFVTGGDGGDGGGNVVFGSASYSWVKNIESAGHGPKYHGALVHFFSSFRCELRDSYVHSNASDIPNIAPGGGYYNIVLDSYNSDSLVENNISWIANKVIVMRGTGGGNVIGYNYMDDGYGNSYPNQGETALNADHMTTSHHELFEGNYSWNLGTDSRWGNSIYITWFRNWSTAQRISAWPGIPSTSAAFGNPLPNYVYSNGGQNFYYEDEYNRVMAKVGSHHWWFNYVGNVLGAASLPLLTNPRSYYNVPQTGYAYQWAGGIAAAINHSQVSMWGLGIPDSSEPSFSGNGLDPSVLPATLRDANFDYFTGTVHWHGIGGSDTNQTTPPGASQSGGAQLPSSLYLQSKPAFFGSSAWPWVDGSNPSNPLPGALPARTRFNLGTPNSSQ